MGKSFNIASICFLLLTGLSLAPARAQTNFVAAEGNLAAHAAGLSVVRPDHYAIYKLDMAAVRESKLVKGAPDTYDSLIENLEMPAEMQEAVANLIANLDVMWMSLGPPPEVESPLAPPFTIGVYMRFKDVDTIKKMIEEFPLESEEVKYGGESYFRPGEIGDGPVYLVRDREYFLTFDDETIRQVIDAKGKIARSPLLEKLKHVNLDAQYVLAGSLGPWKEPSIKFFETAIKESPIPLAPTLAKLPSQVDWASVAVDLDGETLIDIDIDMEDGDAAEQMKTQLVGFVSLAKIGLAQEQKNIAEEPSINEAFALGKKALDSIKIEQQEKHIDATLARVEGLDRLGEIISEARKNAKRAYALSNAQQIALGARSFEADKERPLANLKDESGKEILSWRIAILPYMDQRDLFDEFARAPWDSDRNEWVLDSMSFTYQTEGSDERKTTTWKMLPEAPGGVWFIDAGKGTAEPWSKPDVFSLDPANPKAALGDEPEGGYLVAYKDGRAARLTLEQLKSALAGEKVEPAVAVDALPVDDLSGDEPMSDEPVARVWKDASGRFAVEAVFVEAKDGKVTIRRTDNGKTITVPVNKLSELDQKYIAGRAE